VTRICQTCGALLLTSTESCSFCDVPGETGFPLRRTGRSAEINTDQGDSQWRSEVTRRLEDYRARRRRLLPDPELPSGLRFRPTRKVDEVARERPRIRASAPRPRPTERVDICIQSELDFSSAPDDRAHPETALVPVASLAERRAAGILDAIFISLTGAGFLALFHALGGEIVLAKMDAIVCATILYLFYAQYFFLFTTLAGATLGMQLRGLSVVRLDGSLPDTRQLVWRSLGYLLSGATVLFGFLSALWDEDHFTWQDRLSRTYVTASAPFVADSGEIGPGECARTQR
jgi:uncharacterized RDD family membrane protein YckC